MKKTAANESPKKDSCDDDAEEAALKHFEEPELFPDTTATGSLANAREETKRHVSLDTNNSTVTASAAVPNSRPARNARTDEGISQLFPDTSARSPIARRKSEGKTVSEMRTDRGQPELFPETVAHTSSTPSEQDATRPPSFRVDVSDGLDRICSPPSGRAGRKSRGLSSTADNEKGLKPPSNGMEDKEPELFPDTFARRPVQSDSSSLLRSSGRTSGRIEYDGDLKQSEKVARSSMTPNEEAREVGNAMKEKQPELFPDTVARGSRQSEMDGMDDGAPLSTNISKKNSGIQNKGDLKHAEMLAHAPALDVHDLPASPTEQAAWGSSATEEGATDLPAGDNLAAQTSASSSMVPGAVAVRGIDATEGGDEDDFLIGDERTVVSADPHSSLPQAQTVQAEEDGLFGDLAQAEPVPESDLVKQGRGAISWIKRHKVITAAVLLVVVGAVVGGVIGAISGGGGSGSVDNTLAPTMTPTSAPTISGFDLIAPTLSTITPLSVLTNPTTPQNAAVAWLLREDGHDVDYGDAPKLLQRYALATIYFATNGATWTRQLNFLSDQDDCLWNEPGEDFAFGVQICNEQGLVDTLQLSENGLSGTFPDEISAFASLRFLSAARSNLGGSIPSTIAALSNLEDIRLFENKLSGPIPESLGNLGKLTYLALQMNVLTGSLPPSIGQSTDLINMYLNENQLTGSIPPSLGNLVSLRELFLNGNQLSGTIPTECSAMTSLIQIRLELNNLIGTADPICNGNIDFNGFWSDCLTIATPGVPNVDAEVECSCCTICCADTGACLSNNS